MAVVSEIRAFVEALTCDRARIVSDHILNLLGDLEGDIATDKPELLALIDRFLGLEEREQKLLQLARRAGLVGSLDDLDRSPVRRRAEALLSEVERDHGGDVEQTIRDMMTRFV